MAASASPAAWIHSRDNNNNNSQQKESVLSQMRRRARELVGEETKTQKFVPHLSLVYFDQQELTQDQRLILKTELHQAFPPQTKVHVDTVHVMRTQGPPAEWKVLASFPL